MEEKKQSNDKWQLMEERITQLEKSLENIETEKIDDMLKRISQMEKNTPIAKEVLTVDDACLFLGASKSQLYKLTRTLAIPHYKPSGKFIYFSKTELLEWVKQNPIKTRKEHEQNALKYVMNKPIKRK